MQKTPGGLLLNYALHLKEEGKEYRTLKLYGQEINLITSAIARMNMFMHGIEEFSIVRGDTLAHPAFLENDELQKFNIILANPPYSIKSWDQKSFEHDPYGRNVWGTPPKGCADYAFQQHIRKSLNTENGRSVTLWPHGILFRDAEAEMRIKMIENDLVECVVGLGPNLFYNSPMEACLLITRTKKEKHKKGKVLIINAVKEVKQDKTLAILEDQHIKKIFEAFKEFKDRDGFCKIVDIEEILSKKGSLNIPLYVSNVDKIEDQKDFSELYTDWIESSKNLKQSMPKLFTSLGQ
ncbi:MAG: N-6 DNA methylase [Spirochaetales bacterium]|nr:N-6 DNA methylase [Spirochaetales bacterium]